MARKSKKTSGANDVSGTSGLVGEKTQNLSATKTASDISTREYMDSGDRAGRRTIVGIFDDRADAEHAVRELKDAGFSGDHIGIAMRDRDAQGKLVEDIGTHAGEGALTGAVSGGILGGIAGLLIGVGVLAIPGFGPVIAGGVLATAFGTAAGTAVVGAGIGAAAGGVVGTLVGMGVPEEEARYFEAGFRSGGVLVSVSVQNRAMEALSILERNGADTGSQVNDRSHMGSETSDRDLPGM